MKIRIQRHPKFLVATGNELVEVYDAGEIVAWKSKDGVDAEYDEDRIEYAYKRTAGSSWTRIDVPTLVGLLEHEPGARFWTKETRPNYMDPSADGWEVVQ